MRNKSFFISVEGLEGSGKSSVIKFLAKSLKNKKFSVKVYREPGSTKIGEKIRRILLDNKNKKLSAHTELLLYLAARTQLIEEKLEKDFDKYDFIISDRFSDSTLVYQGFALGLGKIVRHSVKLFALGISPDLTLVLDTDVEIGLSRLKSRDRIESRKLDFHKKLKKGYLQLAKEYPSRVKVIDAGGSLEQVGNRAKNVLWSKIVGRSKPKRK